MKAVVYHGANKLSLDEVGDVTPKAKYVKLRVKACGICGSDVHGYLGLTGRRLEPMIMGHEFAAEVCELGEGVESLKVGDRVTVFPVEFCGECEWCKRGDVHLCPNKLQYGVLACDGAFAEYICAPESVCFKLADDVSYSYGSLVEPLAVAFRGVKHAGDLKGKTVLVVGTGTIGLCALAWIKYMGAEKIFVSDLSDDRLKVAKEMGADVIVNPTKENLKEVILANTDNIGVDYAFEAVGMSPTVQQAMSSLKFGGVAVWIGNNKPMVEVNMQEIVTRELTVFGTYIYGLSEFKEVVDVLNEGKLNMRPVISLEVPLDKCADMFYKLAHNPEALIKVVVVD